MALFPAVSSKLLSNTMGHLGLYNLRNAWTELGQSTLIDIYIYLLLGALIICPKQVTLTQIILIVDSKQGKGDVPAADMQ